MAVKYVNTDICRFLLDRVDREAVTHDGVEDSVVGLQPGSELNRMPALSS